MTKLVMYIFAFLTRGAMSKRTIKDFHFHVVFDIK